MFFMYQMGINKMNNICNYAHLKSSIHYQITLT